MKIKYKFLVKKFSISIVNSENLFTFAKSSNKHTDKISKMQPIVNIRGSITHLPVGDSVRFEKWMTTPRYVRQLCSDLSNERGWMYKVSSKKDSSFIEVTRYA